MNRGQTSSREKYAVTNNWSYKFICIYSRCEKVQVAQLWHRDRASSIDDFKGWANLRLNFRLKGYVSRHYDITLTFTQCFHLRLKVSGDQTSHFTASKDPLTS